MSDNIHPTTLFTNPVTEPLPELIAESIRQAINGGRLKPGEQLPGEPLFAAQLGVSRTTLRDAVRILVSKGILERRRGVGTFIAHNPLVNIQEGLETLLSTTELIRKKGYTPGTSASRWETISANDELAEILDIPPGASLLHLSRTRTANEVPVIHCEEYLPLLSLGIEKFEEPQHDWSLYTLLKEAGFSVSSAICKVAPVVANSDLAVRLDVPLQHPLLLLRQTHYAHDNRPVLYCENYHNSSVIEFHLIRKY